ncbi:hypothetical protein J6590_076024 [Homalodisca vitripennis]|nr:hypothetical protein J6590_076024 [Homalodisca vitripennis]
MALRNIKEQLTMAWCEVYFLMMLWLFIVEVVHQTEQLMEQLESLIDILTHLLKQLRKLFRKMMEAEN